MPELADVLAEHGPAIGRVALAYAAPGSDRDDLLQDIALALVRALPNYRAESSLRTYVLRIAHNCGIRHSLRKRMPNAALEEEQHATAAAGPERELIGRQQLEQLSSYVRELPLGMRQVLALTLEGLAQREIAEVLGLSENVVSVRLHRARAALRERLGVMLPQKERHMDDELNAWCEAWKALPEHDINLVQRAQAAHRREAATHTLGIAALGVCAALLIVASSRTVARAELNMYWPQLALGFAALLVGGVAMRIFANQISSARAQLTDTPHALVEDLIRLHERELFWWQGRASLLTTCVLAASALVLCVARIVRVLPTDGPRAAAWFGLGLTLVSLGALLAYGYRRVKFLRADLASLREAQRQLS